ncbi:DUF2000 domain-containing protein [Kiloniella majae]|uniref:DUF2000 domain-containing protein n=1 Tax=Kiloniella majae TaxID=1938558 RepID=UPI000A278F3F|nr:DUF2000 domain-containing protein [Kiloniella majae]
METVTGDNLTVSSDTLAKETGIKQTETKGASTPHTSRTTSIAGSIDLPATHKCAIVVDQEMPIGFIANTASVLSLSIGKQHPEIIGQDIVDNNGDPHQGITILPVPILKGTAALLHKLREQMRPYEQELTVVDLITATRTTQTYAQYSENMLTTPVEQLSYCGIALYGTKKLVNKFTGNLGLLR